MSQQPFVPKSPLHQFGYIHDFHGALFELSQMATPENWDYQRTPTGKAIILINYINHTFAKIQKENKIEFIKDMCVYNTGLVTENQEELFGYYEKNKKQDSNKQWYFKGWRKSSDNILMNFPKLPELPNYIEEAADLIYDTKIDLRVNIDHIISDNVERFPKSLSANGDYQLGRLLAGTIEDAKSRVKRNYKTAIPQYFKGNIQLLLPLCLTSKSKADLALAVGKENGVYRASTCLTLDMAMNNARLIAKPDDEWLRP